MDSEIEAKPTYCTIDQIKRANKDAGYHWFAKRTMRFFASRILDGVYGGRYFVTSERVPSSGPSSEYPRLYTVREAKPDGKIGTIGEFQQYRTARAARAAARKLAGEG